MKFKSKQLKRAIDAFQYSMPDDALIEIHTKEEDIPNNCICSSLTMTASWQENASKYDTNQEPVSVTQTIEVFSEEENRPFRIITNKVREYKVT